ncbi:CocE/NonD family hydrolase [Sphingosinicella sp. CPCC 101087]|uniref:CocE/NonD family hydrolase n=1 Tax=Sphingosinicella sp. CPCC 101087 TaxID=2497754 RepID=UPI00101D2145|nr:CocE/NonD family hydrolase [Sphingosinicella sp. CPCC 101087]
MPDTPPSRPRFQPLMIPATDPKLAKFKPPHPGTQHEVLRQEGLRIERNIAVPMRDGVKILIDLYLPDNRSEADKVPAIIGWSPYGKHNLSDSLWPAADVQPGWISKYTAFEAPDPSYWCPRGYAVVFPDPRGTWYSEGDFHHAGAQEGDDVYDLIEWLAVQPWCNGKVGMSGVSYLAAAQYQVAPLHPPHLAAINPWEAFSDWYREFGYHGGMRDTGFVPRAGLGLRYGTNLVEDTIQSMIDHPLWDEYWESKVQDLAGIECPAFFVASWSDQGFHTRGTLEAYKAARSPDKFLLVHGQKKWKHYYDPPNVELLRAFFDQYLRGEGKASDDWPKVRIEVRERAHVGHWRDELEWPLARTVYTPFHLDARDLALSPAPVGEEGEASYDPNADDGRACFDMKFEHDTELTGHMKLKLWVETDAGNDMDLFVAIQKLDRDGNVVPFVFYAICDDGPAALGWLRASHRALDEEKSTPWQPIHPHTHEDPLEPGVTVPVEIEIWPSSTLFRAGESLRVQVQGQDVYGDLPGGPSSMRHEELRNVGRHIIRTGGRLDSHLLAPVIPSEEQTQ